MEPDVGLYLTTLGSWPDLKLSWTLNPLSHLGAPYCVFILLDIWVTSSFSIGKKFSKYPVAILLMEMWLFFLRPSLCIMWIFVKSDRKFFFSEFNLYFLLKVFFAELLYTCVFLWLISLILRKILFLLEIR